MDQCVTALTFLQPTGGGNKTLTVSSSYQWTAQHVASSRMSLYTMALDDLFLPDIESEVLFISQKRINRIYGQEGMCINWNT